MEEEEEMKSQCFGGDYLGEVFDHMLKRMSYRKQKRWWNAYMLFYTRLDVEENSLMKSVNELSLCKYHNTIFHEIDLDFRMCRFIIAHILQIRN